MQPRVLLAFAALLALGPTGACTSDLPAPNNYVPGSAGVDSSGNLEVGCEDIPDAAVGAMFDYTPVVTGAGGEAVTWSADDLPSGLAIDPRTGQITGVPTAEGTATVAVTVSTEDGMRTAMCELNVNPALEVDIDLVLENVPYCLRPGMRTLLDVVVPGTGDGSPITCTHEGGTGDGRRPAGISVGRESCEIEGVVEEDRYGTWVFSVRGEQNGASVHVPYCVTNDDTSGYEITVDHSGLGDMNIDGTLVPIVRRFNPDAGIAFGDDGDPRFEIVDQDSCGTNACFYGYSYAVRVGSQFEGSPNLGNRSQGTQGLLRDETTMQPIGFFHSLFWDRSGAVDDAFKTRPWTVNIDLAYCIADNEGDPDDDEDGPCESGNIVPNAGGEFEVSILMIPD